MAVPFLTAGVNKLGREFFKIGSGFVSRNVFKNEKRRQSRRKGGPRGKFRSKTDVVRGLDDRQLESYLRDVFGGGPLGGGSWVARVKRSSERFTDILAEQNEL